MESCGPKFEEWADLGKRTPPQTPQIRQRRVPESSRTVSQRDIQRSKEDIIMLGEESRLRDLLCFRSLR